ncbi:Sugar transporter 4, partial [Operophtera brumata]
IGWLSPMGPLLKSTSTPASEPFSDADVSWLAAALPLAAICGIPFFSYSSDRFGRKLSWITPTALIVARVIAGLAAGGCFIVVPVYIKEISEDSWRGALGSMNMTLCK